jgi:isopentenyl-diphosphate delta-isomerase type 1
MENTTKKVNNWDSVILVDTQDNELGIKEKLQAHLDGDLHRAFSIFIFNSKNELLLQQRALSKYHSPAVLLKAISTNALWTKWAWFAS